MANTELIAKIKAEIERLYDGEAPAHDQQCEFEDGYFTGIDKISNFLDTLESENPVPNDLKEAVKNYIYKAADSPGDDWTTDDIRNAYIA